MGSYVAQVVKWHTASFVTAQIRALEPESERRTVAPPASIVDVERDMRECAWERQGALDFDAYPSPERVWHRRCQKPSSEAKILLDVLSTQAKKKGIKVEPWKPSIGDCQAFAVLAAARIQRLPPTEGVRLIRIVSLSVRKPSGHTGGHAACIYRTDKPKAAAWWAMQQGGRLGGAEGYSDARSAVEGIAKSLSGGSRLLWWAELSPSDLALMGHHDATE